MGTPSTGEGETPESLATIPAQPEASWLRWERGLRFIAFGLVTVVVALGGVGLLGVTTTTSMASGNGYRLEVLHARTTRAGLATPFSVEVSTEDGRPLPETATIRVSSPYLALFDDNGMEPIPTDSYNNATWTWWSFAVPAGHSALRVDLDARLEPAVQKGREASAAFEIDGVEMVEVEFSTGVLP